MSNYDWSKFCKRIPIQAKAQEIYNAWATRSGIEKWFLKSSEFKDNDKALRAENETVQQGDEYKWQWYGYDDQVVEYGKIIEANGKDFLKFTFAGNCYVSVIIKEEQGEVVIELWQENIPIDEAGKTNIHLGCSEGWTFYLANLKSFLEGGIDLRNKNEMIKKVVSS